MKKKSMVIGIMIGFALLALSLRGIDTSSLVRVMAQGRWEWLLLAVPLYASGFFLRSIRWALLLAPVRRFSAFRLFPLVIVGFFVNMAGLRIGELTRAYVMGRNLQFPKTTALATVLVERVFDVLVLLSVFVVISLFLPNPSAKRLAIVVSVGCLLLALFGLVFVAKNPHILLKLMQGVLTEKWWGKIQDLLMKFHEGLSVVRDPRQIAAVLALSIVIWSIEAGTIWTMAQVSSVSLGVFGAFATLTGLAVGSLIPTPGAVGTFEHFGTTALTSIGISQEPALATILLLHAFQLIFLGTAGLLSFWREGLHWAQLQDMEKTDS